METTGVVYHNPYRRVWGICENRKATSATAWRGFPVWRDATLAACGYCNPAVQARRKPLYSIGDSPSRDMLMTFGFLHLFLWAEDGYEKRTGRKFTREGDDRIGAAAVGDVR